MAKHNHIHENELIHRIAEGDTTAFDQLFLAHYNRLLRFAKSLLPYPSDGAEDIVCAVFGQLWERRSDIQISSSVAAYLYTSVKNGVLKEANRDRIYERVPGEPPEYIDIADSGYNEPDNILQYKELDEQIRELIDKLPERTKIVLLMSRNDRLTYEEIAILLDISIHSVKTHMYRALLFLKTSVYKK